MDNREAIQALRTLIYATRREAQCDVAPGLGHPADEAAMNRIAARVVVTSILQALFGKDPSRKQVDRVFP